MVRWVGADPKSRFFFAMRQQPISEDMRYVLLQYLYTNVNAAVQHQDIKKQCVGRLV